MMTGFGLGGAWMMAAWVVFWVFVVAGILWVVLTVSRPREGQSGSADALRILEERLARGEINAEEFRTRRAAIAGTGR